MNINTKEKKFKERIKFYADTPKDRNKRFCFEIVSIFELKDTLWRFFDKGWNIRAAYYEKVNVEEKKIIENTKLNLFELLQEYIEVKSKQQRKHRRP